LCFVLGQVIGAFLWAILPRYRKLARENLSAVFANEKSSPEIRRRTFRHFTTLGLNGICSFKVAFQRPETRFGTIYQALRNPYLDELINRDLHK
jgi:lauroyl/myristoyl acyltransferase